MRKQTIMEFLASKGSPTNLRNIGVSTKRQLTELIDQTKKKTWDQNNPERALLNSQIFKRRTQIKKTLIKLSLCLI